MLILRAGNFFCCPNAVMLCLHRDNMTQKKEEEPTPSSQRSPNNIMFITWLGGSGDLAEVPSIYHMSFGQLVVEH